MTQKIIYNHLDVEAVDAPPPQKSEIRREVPTVVGGFDPSKRTAPVKFIISMPIDIHVLPKQGEE